MQSIILIRVAALVYERCDYAKIIRTFKRITVGVLTNYLMFIFSMIFFESVALFSAINMILGNSYPI